MKYVFIEKHQAEFSIKAMCRVLRVARSGWYTWCQRRTRISTRQQFRQHCDSVVLAAFTRSKQRYGAPRLTDELRAQGYPFNVKTVAASLRRQGLRARVFRLATLRSLEQSTTRCYRHFNLSPRRNHYFTIGKGAKTQN